MKIPIDSIDFVKTKLTAEQLAEKLSSAGFLVEGIDNGVLDIEVTANRGDCLSVFGIAREIAAILGEKLNIAEVTVKDQDLNLPLKIKIADPKICSRYTYRIITGVRMGESPQWLKDELEKFDFKPVSNIVDVTNYVMMEMGQPLHAFDYDKLSKEKEMIIRGAKKGEQVSTLDDTNHKLPDGAIVIENDGRLIDLAGIMGGENSQVTAETKTIILQAALFDPILIRRTCKKLNFSTDASYRYERGIDPEGTKLALDRATGLILEIAGGSSGKLEDTVSLKYKSKKIEFTPARINDLLGTNISIDKMEEYLKSLGFEISSEVDTKKIVHNFAQVPSWRLSDINLWQDIAEEIARIYGYSKITPKVLAKEKPQNQNKDFICEQKIAGILTKANFVETLSYSFVSEKDLKAACLNPKDCSQLENPLSLEYQYLRPKLGPTILKQIAKNPWAPEINIFEIGTVFTKDGEKKELILATTFKGDVFEQILKDIKKEFDLLDLPYKICKPEQGVLDYFKIRRPVQILEIDLEKLLEKAVLKSSEYEISAESSPLGQKKIKYKPVSKFPPTIRDLAFILARDISAVKVAKEIEGVDKSIFIVELFDEYASEKLGKNKKNLAYHIWFSDLKKTLSDEGVEKIIQKITTQICKKYKAKLRDF